MDDFECGLSIRERVEAALPDDLVDRLRELIGARREERLFRERLITILIRHDRYLANATPTPKNKRRKQFKRLQDRASGFLAALDALPPDVTRDLSTSLNAVTHDERWAGWTFEGDDPIPEEDRSLEDARKPLGSIVEACRLQLSILEGAKGEKKKSSNPALDQLLIDLGALYEAETGHSAKSQCYRDETSEDEYNGRFFQMAKAILDGYAPDSYGTPAALGMRFVRLRARRLD